VADDAYTLHKNVLKAFPGNLTHDDKFVIIVSAEPGILWKMLLAFWLIDFEFFTQKLT
jgi:hypothetical protein